MPFSGRGLDHLRSLPNRPALQPQVLEKIVNKLTKALPSMFCSGVSGGVHISVSISGTHSVRFLTALPPPNKERNGPQLHSAQKSSSLLADDSSPKEALGVRPQRMWGIFLDSPGTLAEPMQVARPSRDHLQACLPFPV